MSRVKKFLAKYLSQLKWFDYLLLAGSIVCFGIGLLAWLALPQGTAELKFTGPAPEQDALLKSYVYISGAVLSPGIYQVSTEDKVADVLKRAGGLRDSVDLDFVSRSLNLAALVKNSDHIFIPFAQHEVSASKGEQAEASDLSTEGKVNLNSAGQTELERISGVGASLAQKLIAARPFNSWEDVDSVSGVGPSLLENLKSEGVL